MARNLFFIKNRIFLSLVVNVTGRHVPFASKICHFWQKNGTKTRFRLRFIWCRNVRLTDKERQLILTSKTDKYSKISLKGEVHYQLKFKKITAWIKNLGLDEISYFLTLKNFNFSWPLPWNCPVFYHNWPYRLFSDDARTIPTCIDSRQERITSLPII